MANRRYSATTWERATATATALGIVVLAGFLVIRNEPFKDPNLVVATRVLLSLATSLLGGTIPGFLNVGWSGRGMIIRAGGALALFVITYLLTPTVIPAMKDDSIEPLVNPRRISRTLPDAYGMIRTVAFQRKVAPTSGLRLRAVYEGDSKDKQMKRFDVLLSNAGGQQLLVSKLRVRWLYEKGFLSAIERGEAIRPVAKYSVTLPIDTDQAGKLFEKSIDLYPPIAMPPGTDSNPSVVSFRLEVLYSFAGRLSYHPNSDWSLLYDITVQDDLGGNVKVLSMSWRKSRPGWLEDYCENKAKVPECSEPK
jgi:hypothetical protein